MKGNTSSTVQAETRRLAAIMFTDIVGFSRQMGSNEARTLRLLEVHNQLIQQAVREHHGTVIKTIGDAFLVDFPSVVHAVQCAQAVHAQLRTYNAEKEKTEQIHVRIGIHLGDIVQKEGDVFGDGVNIAARLQSLAEPDSICLSQKVYEEVAKKLDLGTVVSLGKPKLKNIAERFAVYALLATPPKGIRQALRVQYLKLSRRVGTAHRVAAMVVLLAVVSAGAIALRERYLSVPPSLPLPDKPSIAVLPFANLSDDPQQEYFGDGLTYDLITDLSKLSGLVVIASRSTLTYKGKAVKVQEVSKELGVRYVLEGSVRETGDRILINAQMVDATTGGHVWADRYDRPRRDLYAVQAEVGRKILLHLGLRLTPEDEERLQRTYTPNLEAYNDAMHAMESVWRGTPADNAQARQLSEKAIALDPNYAVAYAVKGFSYAQAWVNQWTQDPQALEQAFALAQQALALDDFSPLAHELLGAVYLLRDKQYEQAIAEQKRAIAHGPSWFSAHTWLGATLNLAGRPEEAIPLLEQGLRLSPRSVVDYLPILAQAYALTGRYEEAITTYKKVLAVAPHYPLAHMGLTVVYSELGREEEARAEAAEILRLNPKFSLEALKQRLLYKDPAQSERVLAALRKAGLK